MLCSNGGDSATARKDLLIDEVPLEEYVDQFAWNSLKYRTDLSVREIAEYLFDEVNQIDNLIKARMNSYYQGKAEIEKVTKNKTYNSFEHMYLHKIDLEEAC